VLAGAASLAEDLGYYLPCAIAACTQGVKRAHLISRHRDGALLSELFTREGVGTLITPMPLETLRPATIDDVGGILGLIEPLERDGILVRRSRELLEMEIERFLVLESDGVIAGCAALYPFPEERGFVESTPDQLPKSKQALYNYKRRSKVLEKSLRA